MVGGIGGRGEWQIVPEAGHSCLAFSTLRDKDFPEWRSLFRHETGGRLQAALRSNVRANSHSVMRVISARTLMELSICGASPWCKPISCGTDNGDEVAEFVGDVCRVVHGGGDLDADEFPETRAQAMNGDFHCGLGHAERAGDSGL